MATSATLGHTGPNFSLPILVITVLYFCGLSSATTPHAIISRQGPPDGLPKCVQDCYQHCWPPSNGSLEASRDCAEKCATNEAEARRYKEAATILCKFPSSISTASVDSGSVPTTLVFESVTPSTALVTTTSIGSTTSPSITAVNSSNDNASGENTTANKKGSDLSIPIIVAIAVGGTVFLGMCVGLWYLILCLKKRKRREKEQRHVGNKGFDNSPISDFEIPLGSAGKKEIGRGAPWTDEENNNNSTAHLHSTSAMNKPHPPLIATKFAPPVPPRPRDGLGGAPSGGFSPVSPVSPLSGYAAFTERRDKAISTVSSMKPERTHRDFYTVTSPPLPTPASTVGSRYSSTRKSKPAKLVTGPGATSRPESEYPPEPVSPLSRNPSGKTRSEVSAVGEEQLAWESYRDMIRKYEGQQAQSKPSLPEVIQRMSGLSQFNFGFGESQPQLEAEKKRESSFYGWAPEKSPGGHINMASGQNKDKYLSGSSSVYSSQPMTPPVPITREAGPSTPEMFFGRPPPNCTPPSAPPATAGRSFVGVSQPSSHKPEPPIGVLARANSLRRGREVEAATDQALNIIADPRDGKRNTPQKSSGFWSLFTPKLPGASPKIGTVPSCSGNANVARDAASSEMSLVSEGGRSGVVII